MFSGIVFALEIDSEKKNYPTGLGRARGPTQPARACGPARHGPSGPSQAAGLAAAAAFQAGVPGLAPL
jgi:hypothetical protein